MLVSGYYNRVAYLKCAYSIESSKLFNCNHSNLQLPCCKRNFQKTCYKTDFTSCRPRDKNVTKLSRSIHTKLSTITRNFQQLYETFKNYTKLPIIIRNFQFPLAEVPWKRHDERRTTVEHHDRVLSVRRQKLSGHHRRWRRPNVQRRLQCLLLQVWMDPEYRVNHHLADPGWDHFEFGYSTG